VANRKTEFIVGRLLNQTGSAEGPTLPPKQKGSFRVPVVSHLKLARTSSFSGGTQFTLTWEDPEDPQNIAQYNVFVKGALSDNREPMGPYTFKRSPANVRVIADAISHVVLVVQTQLKNGMVSDVTFSPSVSGVTVSPVIAVGDIGDGTPGQIITWDATNNAITVGPGETWQFLRGNGTGQPVSFTNILLRNALAATLTDGLVLENDTAATAGVPVQGSPALRTKAGGWNTGGTPAAHTTEWNIVDQPDGVGLTNVVPVLTFWSRTDAAAFVKVYEWRGYLDPGLIIHGGDPSYTSNSKARIRTRNAGSFGWEQVTQDAAVSLASWCQSSGTASGWLGTTTNHRLVLNTNNSNGSVQLAANGLLWIGGTNAVNQVPATTVHVKDTTAVTGVTTVTVDAGAGQGTTALFQGRNNIGTPLSVIGASGEGGFGTGAAVDEILHSAKAVDGDAVTALLENSQANAGGSTNETSQLRFGFGGNNDVARIVVGKEGDYTSGAAEDSFMALYTDRDGTATEAVRIESSGEVGFGITAPKSQVETLTLGHTVVVKTNGTHSADGTATVYLCNATAGNITINLPAAAGVTSRIYHIKKTDASANTVTIDGSGAETIDGATTVVLAAQYESRLIVSDGANWHIL